MAAFNEKDEKDLFLTKITTFEDGVDKEPDEIINKIKEITNSDVIYHKFEKNPYYMYPRDFEGPIIHTYKAFNKKTLLKLIIDEKNYTFHEKEKKFLCQLLTNDENEEIIYELYVKCNYFLDMHGFDSIILENGNRLTAVNIIAKINNNNNEYYNKIFVFINDRLKNTYTFKFKEDEEHIRQPNYRNSIYHRFVPFIREDGRIFYISPGIDKFTTEDDYIVDMLSLKRIDIGPIYSLYFNSDYICNLNNDESTEAKNVFNIYKFSYDTELQSSNVEYLLNGINWSPLAHKACSKELRLLIRELLFIYYLAKNKDINKLSSMLFKRVCSWIN